MSSPASNHVETNPHPPSVRPEALRLPNPPLIFVDLDDTLFQTQEKCPPGQPLHPVAFLRDGTPHSFMSVSQRRLFEGLHAWGTLIPTTARNWDSFQRVRLDFSSYKILDYGALVLGPDSKPDPTWWARTQAEACLHAAELNDLCQRLTHWVRQENLSLLVKLVHDLDVPLYLVMKQARADQPDLGRVLQERILPDHNGWWVHHHGRQLAVAPAYLGKEHAVRYVREKLMPQGSWAVGVGDSRADTRFLAACDYAMVPAGSELHSHLGEYDLGAHPCS